MDLFFGGNNTSTNNPNSIQNANNQRAQDIFQNKGSGMGQVNQQMGNMNLGGGQQRNMGLAGNSRGNLNMNVNPDTSSFSLYNQLNTSNMKDMSTIGINNFMDIQNQQNPDQGKGTAQNPPANQNKFDLRDEPQGVTAFDQPQDNKK